MSIRKIAYFIIQVSDFFMFPGESVVRLYKGIIQAVFIIFPNKEFNAKNAPISVSDIFSEIRIMASKNFVRETTHYRRRE